MGLVVAPWGVRVIGLVRSAQSLEFLSRLEGLRPRGQGGIIIMCMAKHRDNYHLADYRAPDLSSMVS